MVQPDSMVSPEPAGLPARLPETIGHSIHEENPTTLSLKSEIFARLHKLRLIAPEWFHPEKNSTSLNRKQQQERRMLNEFKAFIARGNVMDLAVGVIIGAAFSRIVDSIVNDLVMPIVGALTGGGF